MAYSQQDPAWAHILLGFNTSSLYTIGTAGCYVTAIANICNWAGHDLNPQQINDICKQNNWFVEGGLLTRDDIPALLCSNLGFTGRTNWSGPTDMNFFNDASSPDVAYIIEIDASPRAGIQTHYTMVWAKPDATDLTIDDSWDGIRKTLSHYGSPSAVILSAMRFVKVAPPSQPTPPPVVAVPAPVPPPEVVPEPTPIVSPPTPPAAPVSAAQAEKYKLVTTLMTYATSTDALMDVNAQSTLSAGSYYVWTKNGKAYQLGKDNMHEPVGNWVNTAENVVTPPSTRLNPPEMTKDLPNPVGNPPAGANWRGTLNLAFAGRYVFYNHDPSQKLVDIIDLETMQPVTKNGVPLRPHNGDFTQFSGKVKGSDDNWYGRLKDTTIQFKWYATRIEDIKPYNEIYGTKTTLAERQVLNTLTKTDKIELWLAKIKTLGADVWDVVRPKEKK
jgi:hypothetical protein